MAWNDEQLREARVQLTHLGTDVSTWMNARCPFCQRQFALSIAPAAFTWPRLACPFVCEASLTDPEDAPSDLAHVRHWSLEALDQTPSSYVNCSCETLRAVDAVISMCPVCAKHDGRDVFRLRLMEIRERLADAVDDSAEARDALSNSVSLFDGYGRATVRAWTGGLATGERFSFQNLAGARNRLVAADNFDISRRVPPEDWSFALRMFEQRHLLAHKLGVVDQHYVSTVDPSATLGAPVRVSTSDVARLISIIEVLGVALYAVYIS